MLFTTMIILFIVAIFPISAHSVEYRECNVHYVSVHKHDTSPSYIVSLIEKNTGEFIEHEPGKAFFSIPMTDLWEQKKWLRILQPQCLQTVSSQSHLKMVWDRKLLLRYSYLASFDVLMYYHRKPA